MPAIATPADISPVASAPGSPQRMRFWLRLALVPIVLMFGLEFGRVYFGNNSHAVIPGLVYRTAQPSPEMLQDAVRAYGIRTVINLRGCGQPFDWYMDECRAVRELGINLEDVSFSANRTPSATELRRLVEVLDRTEFPVLLHCRRGADRTGMASVIAVLLKSDTPLAEARRQLGPRYGHIPLSHTMVLDRFFDLYEAWLGKAGRTHDGETFRHWILNEYGRSAYSYAWVEWTPLQSAIRRGEPLAFRVRVRNTSDRTWPIKAGSYAGMHIGFQIFEPGKPEPIEGRAGKLDREVHPGESWEVTLVLPPLRKPGPHRLLVDMVEENVCWFFQAGAAPHEEELHVAEDVAQDRN